MKAGKIIQVVVYILNFIAGILDIKNNKTERKDNGNTKGNKEQ